MPGASAAITHDPIVSVSPMGAVSVGGVYSFPAIETRASATGTAIPASVLGLGTTGADFGATGTALGATGRTYSTSGTAFTPSGPNIVALGTGSGGSMLAGLSTLTPYSGFGTGLPTAMIDSSGLPTIPSATIGQTGPLTTFAAPSYMPTAATGSSFSSITPDLTGSVSANPYLTSAIGTAGVYPISRAANNLYLAEIRSVNPYLASATLANPYLATLESTTPILASIAAANPYLATIDAMNPYVGTISTYNPYVGAIASVNPSLAAVASVDPYLTTASSLYSGLNMA